jgi:serine/threonine protein phosphatase 1
LDRQIAISDIHGCARTFEKLLFHVLAIQPSDQLFLLGDYINKGPDSKGVIDLILRLEKEGFPCYSLRGNHEQYLIDALENPEQEMEFLGRGGIETLQSFGVNSVHDIPEEYLEFILKLGFYMEFPDYLLVHAGLNFNEKDLFADEFAMLNTRAMQVDPDRIGCRKIVHGHVPTPILEIEKSLDFKNLHVSIDAGCVYKHIHALRHLVALELDTRELFVQQNID